MTCALIRASFKGLARPRSTTYSSACFTYRLFRYLIAILTGTFTDTAKNAKKRIKLLKRLECVNPKDSRKLWSLTMSYPRIVKRIKYNVSIKADTNSWCFLRRPHSWLTSERISAGCSWWATKSDRQRIILLLVQVRFVCWSYRWLLWSSRSKFLESARPTCSASNPMSLRNGVIAQAGRGTTESYSAVIKSGYTYATNSWAVRAAVKTQRQR